MKNLFYKALFASALFFSCASTNKELDEARLLRERSLRFARVAEISAETFASGEENFAEGERLSAEKKGKKAAKAALLKAIDGYKATIQTGMPAYNDELRQKIDDVLAKAEEIKLKISAEEQFAAATGKYESAKQKANENADTILASANYDDALAELEAVLAEMEALYNEIKQRYDASLAEIDIIKEKAALLESLIDKTEKSGAKK